MAKLHNSYTKRIALAAIGILILLTGIAAGVYLIGQQQEVREKAASPTQSPLRELRY